ncbi:MAG: flavodoxin family protein [Oscillospiraceae bacterium]|nr:flavodoxin family protein [Oscillospiraceae bacterium]
MNVLILQGSPRKQGNTKQLSEPFVDELQKHGAQVWEEWVYDKELKPCLGCGACQERLGEIGCVREDDFEPLVRKMLAADLTVFSTPIYAWFPPAPMIAFWDRLMYATIKRYGSVQAPSLLRGKATAIIVTGGFDPKQIVVPFEMAMQRFAFRHEVDYLGWAGGTDPGKGRVFMNEKKEQRMRSFARTLLEKMEARSAGEAAPDGA